MNEQSTEETAADPVAADDTAADPAAADQVFADEVDADQFMADLVKKEKARTITERARATLERLNGIDWDLEHRKQEWRIVKRRAEQTISNVEWRRAKEAEARRRERGSGIIYKTRDEAWCAKQEAKQERHRASLAEAARHLVGYPGSEALVEKYLPQQTRETATSPTVEPASLAKAANFESQQGARRYSESDDDHQKARAGLARMATTYMTPQRRNRGIAGARPLRRRQRRRRRTSCAKNFVTISVIGPRS